MEATPIIVAGVLLGALAIGRTLNHFLPQSQLSPEARDSMKLAVGWVATMSALVLGLLVNSAKMNYDMQRNTVIQLSAKIAMLDRVLEIYGPETHDARVQLRTATESFINGLWNEKSGGGPNLSPDKQAGATIYAAIHALTPRDDPQKALKTQALTLTTQIGELRALLAAQSVAYISPPLLMVLITWLVVIFSAFSVLAPRNVTAITTLIVSAFSISLAIFLIIELDRPFGGLIRIPSEPLMRALSPLGN